MRSAIVVAAISIVSSTPAFAHHSSTRFDLEKTVDLVGVVARLEWANPHVYIYLDASDGSGQWEIESLPPAAMRRLGWSPDSLAAGERVAISVYPHKTRALEGHYKSVEKADGTKLGSVDETREAYTTRGSAPRASAESLVGIWLTLLNFETEPHLRDPQMKDRSVWPLTPAAETALATYREEVDHPGINCVPRTAPTMMFLPDTKAIELRGEDFVIRGELDNVDRVVHMNVDSHAGAEASLQGHSIGRWEARTLVVDTRLFTEHRNSTFKSLPSSVDKHLVERFELAANGETLLYSYVLEDPKYLTAPVTGRLEFAYRPDLTYSPPPCNLENARRFMKE